MSVASEGPAEGEGWLPEAPVAGAAAVVSAGDGPAGQTKDIARELLLQGRILPT